MTAILFTWVFLQAILLWDIECSPIKKGFAPQYEGGYSQDPWGAQPKQQMYPSHETSGSMSGPGAQGLSSGALPSPPPAAFSGGYSSPTGSSQGSWAIPPHMFSGGSGAASDSDAGPKGQMAGPGSAPPPGPEFVPGALLNIESTMEDGRYESETQERDVPPPPSYEAAVGQAKAFPSPAAFMPQASLGYFYPYDVMFITGQYPPGTYTQSSSNVERGRDDWQENHYIRYDYPAKEQEQQMQSYSQYWDQSYQPVEPVGPGKGQDVEQQFQAYDGQWVG
ncbi:unnamed protein product [Boreogadus saida]